MLLDQLLSTLSVEVESFTPWLAAVEHERLAPVIERLIEDPGAPHTVNALAEAVAMSRFSRSHFSQAFSRDYGVTPTAFRSDS